MNLPSSLRALLDERLAALEAAGVALPADRDAVEAVLIGSNFIFEQLLKCPPWWRRLLDEGALVRRAAAERYQRIAEAVRNESQDRDGLMHILRQYKAQEAVRIAWRDLAGLAELDETLQDTSRLAEALIQAALAWFSREMEGQFGVPRDADGEAMKLVVIGMGKLGAGELNFSSDVDLVFAYPRPGETDGARRLAADEYFQRLARQLVQVLDEVTAEGYVYRVDLRLRPHGEAGRLALSLAAMEDYFQRDGRDWERYAWIKAQPVAGDVAFGAALLKQLKPFVFRRYLDWSALQALRELKRQVEQEVKRRQLQDDIKLGPGGIREIEFIAQVFQLIRGGRDPALRDRRLIATLERLPERQLLKPPASAALIEAYRFLRRLENRLQILDDRQTHRLPRGALERSRIAASMGFADWAAFEQALDGVRERVNAQFEIVFNWPAADTKASADGDDGTNSLWGDGTNETTAHQALERLGFKEPKAALAGLEKFRRGAKVQTMGARGRERLDQFMPRLLAALHAGPAPDRALTRLLQVLEAITRRSVYLSMLLENPALVERVCRLCGDSGWVAREIARTPLLLDELLKPDPAVHEQDDAALQAELSRALGAVGTADLEQSMEALAQFKQANSFQVALAELSGVCDAVQAGAALSALARVVLGAALELARGGRDAPQLAIIAYGRLGATELAYESDLDLVFLYPDDTHPEQAGDCARLARRLTHLLTTQTATGRLYPVDTRLRPNGQAGLLVSPLSAYRDYQLQEAWTWEQQALVRARCVVGGRGLSEGFAQARRDALVRPRDQQKLRTDIRDMRARMRREQDSANKNLKQGAGGLVDVEFLVQYAVLANAGTHPELIQDTGTLPLLARLSNLQLIAPDKANTLALAYRALLQAQHWQTLEAAGVDEAALSRHREAIRRVWENEFGSQP